MGILAHFEDSPMVMRRDGFFLHESCLDLSYAVFSLGKLSPSLSLDIRLDSPFYFAAEMQIHFCKYLSNTPSIDQCHGQLLLCGMEGQFFYLEIWENLAIAAISQFSPNSYFLLLLSIIYSGDKFAWTFTLTLGILEKKHWGLGPSALPIPIL